MNSKQRRKARRACDLLLKVIVMRLRIEGKLELAHMMHMDGSAMLKAKPCRGSYWANMSRGETITNYRRIAMGILKERRK